ncbi:MAG: phosphoribosylformylglycinamidine synthase subunit PurS [Candidatus Ancillula sp.]|jgi:phosphoribosylformylglycinamidine synthase|nr:phosphoribosylformylglycinamidine synthase subunit PurS [Candidatus Ancillula sp.]
MGVIVVEVMPKEEILDPQGKAIVGALNRMGIKSVVGARQGKRFELTVDGKVTLSHLEDAKKAAELLLSNPVIEQVIRVSESGREGAGGMSENEGVTA